MKTMVLLLFIAILLALNLVVCIVPPTQETPREKPSIYILSLNKYQGYEEKETWILQFCVDGRIELANFTKSGDCAAFMEYLKIVGNVHESE